MRLTLKHANARASGLARPLASGLALPLALGLVLAATAHAELFNHKVILVGDKGAALGGAFAGLADDATATWYNPAGLTQLKQLKLNVSAQLVQFQKQKIEIADSEVLPYNSFNFSPSITSMSQKAGRWAFGFSIVTPQNDLYQGRQDLEASYFTSGDPGDYCYSGDGTNTCTSRLALNYYELSKSTLVGPSLAYTYSDALSLGLTLYGIYSSQIEKTSYGSAQSQFVGGDSTDAAKFYDNVLNRDISQSGLGFTAVFGALIRPVPGFQLGLTATPGHYVFVTRNEIQRVEEFLNGAPITPGSGRVATLATLYSLEKEESHTEVTAPSLSAGAAWSPTAWLTLSSQIDYHLGSTYTYRGYSPRPNDSARSGFDLSQPMRFDYTVEKHWAVNFSGGIDLRFSREYSLTLGGWTDQSQGPYDSRPSSWDRRIDWYGVALSIGVAKEYTESRFGVSAAYGDAGISHFRWDKTATGQPVIVTDEAGSVVRDRQIFNAYNIAVFLSSTLKV